MGAQKTTDKDQDQGISFQLGAEKAHVLILKPEHLAQRNAVLEAILNLSSIRYKYQLVYLAAPRLFGASLDALVFRSRGIGLLFYDERRIDEAVPAQSLQAEEATGPSRHDDSMVVTELATLKTMYIEMEQTINQLRDQLSNFQNSHSKQEGPSGIVRAAQVMPTPPSFQGPIHAGELPSYFTNNPWLDVLSKRGNGEREPLAG